MIPTPTFANSVIAERALVSARSSHPEIETSNIEPTIISMELTTLTTAMQKIRMNEQASDINRPVWLVSLRGVWFLMPSAPGVQVTPPMLTQCYLIFDAATNEEIGSTFQP
ncbi:MAG: hypothetical protein KAX40_11660 [Herpetosiphon sp.]|nr:hypothetical protein [Herpetosiphon sp.]